jgi:hypothetical protein
MSLLFAIDPDKEEVIVSDSPKGSNKVQFIERLSRQENPFFYQAVELLTTFSKAPHFDVPIFKALDKACVLIYNKHKES